MGKGRVGGGIWRGRCFGMRRLCADLWLALAVRSVASCGFQEGPPSNSGVSQNRHGSEDGWFSVGVPVPNPFEKLPFARVKSYSDSWGRLSAWFSKQGQSLGTL